ncbi:MAG TPA: hypothetical protein VHB77_08520 [Planctomycetaceae bacterium]|nr:hypothetical protein [Planctomycetaceae bacterium]
MQYFIPYLKSIPDSHAMNARSAVNIENGNLQRTKRQKKSLGEQLGECDKSKLIQLMLQIAERHPDVESWLRLAVSTAAPAPKVDPNDYRKQAARAFERADCSREGERGLTSSLESLREIGDQFLKSDNEAAAAAVYSGILQGFLNGYETYFDKSGDVSGEAQQCVEAIGDCLEELGEDTPERKLALRTLFDFLKFDIDAGGISLADAVPEILIERTTPAERSVIAQWIRSGLPKADDSRGEWKRSNWGSILIDLSAEPMDDEAFLQHCREFGLIRVAVQRLLDEGRLDEAVLEMHALSNHDLALYADQLTTLGHVELARKLIMERMAQDPKADNWQLRTWLKRHYQSQQDWPALLALYIEDYRATPKSELYGEIRELAQIVGTWDGLRSELIALLSDKSSELIRVHLLEGNVGHAIELFDSPANGFFEQIGRATVALEVAQAAEASHTTVAARIYRAQAEQLIARRSRDNYRAACGFLKKVQQLYQQLDRAAEFKSVMARLREQCRSLRALHEELRYAGL